MRTIGIHTLKLLIYCYIDQPWRFHMFHDLFHLLHIPFSLHVAQGQGCATRCLLRHVS